MTIKERCLNGIGYLNNQRGNRDVTAAELASLVGNRDGDKVPDALKSLCDDGALVKKGEAYYIPQKPEVQEQDTPEPVVTPTEHSSEYVDADIDSIEDDDAPPEEVVASKSEYMSMSEYVKTLRHNVTEVRIFKKGRPYRIGHFNDPDLLVEAVESFTFDHQNDETITAVYHSLQDVKQEYFDGRKHTNTLIWQKDAIRNGDTSMWTMFPIDVDPVKGDDAEDKDSATQSEVMLALQKAGEIRDWFASNGIVLLEAMSGNGAHLLIPIKPEPATDENRSLVKRMGNLLNSHFISDNNLFSVDKKVYNSGRVWKLYGTVTRKGPGTERRPHRTSRIKRGDVVEYTLADLERVIGTLGDLNPPAQPKQKGSVSYSNQPSNGKMRFCGNSLPEWEAYITNNFTGVNLTEWIYVVGDNGNYHASRVDCIFHSGHVADACFTYGDNGKPGYMCQHNGCSDMKLENVYQLYGIDKMLPRQDIIRIESKDAFLIVMDDFRVLGYSYNNRPICDDGDLDEGVRHYCFLDVQCSMQSDCSGIYYIQYPENMKNPRAEVKRYWECQCTCDKLVFFDERQEVSNDRRNNATV